MSIRKTDRDIGREEIALKMNEKLIGTGISVAGGGGTSPFIVTVKYLNRKDIDRLIPMLHQYMNSLPFVPDDK